MMHRLGYMTAGFCFLYMFVTEPIEAAGDDANRSALTSIGAVSSLDSPPDPDDPGIGGGFDQVSYFRNRFIPKLGDCTTQIAAVFRDWASAHDLMLPLQEAVAGDLLIHATQEGLAGLFEMTYRVDPELERARVTVYFFSSDGARHIPLAIRDMLDRWEISDLQDALDRALACGRV